MTTRCVYNLRDFENIGSTGLPDYVSASLNALFASVGYNQQTVNTYINQFSVATPSSSSSSSSSNRIVQKAREVQPTTRVFKKAKAKEDEWKRPAFKATVFAELDNTQVLINEIRTELNKINANNYEGKIPVFFEKIAQILELVDFGDDVQLTDKMSAIFNTFFTVCISNKMFAKIYATVLVEIHNKFDFGDLIKESIAQYLQSMQNIVDVDSNVDYDGFCELTTRDNNRKNITNLFCEIAKTDKMELIRPAAIHAMVGDLVRHVVAAVDRADKLKEVEEITENLVIIFSHFDEEFKAGFKSQFESLISIKKPGMSSRTKFKYMDLIGK
jgi:hypothetical protein